MKIKSDKKIGLHIDIDKLFRAMNTSRRVCGFTHQFYRYPARFSPIFAREIIETFTESRESVLDPFMGAGTSLIEATAMGRRAIGIDISSLATFLARVKTTPLSNRELESIQVWLNNTVRKIKLNRKSNHLKKWMSYQKSVPWWIRKIMELILEEIVYLKNERSRRFARCVLLKTGQWCLDCRKEFPDSSQFLNMFQNNFVRMRRGMEEYVENVEDNFDGMISNFTHNCRIIKRSAIGLELDKRIPKSWLPPRLVLTSPPYPGVHVLYHRWQVKGRHETPAPFWLANKLDGNGASFYTLGGRNEEKLDTYFERITSAFRSISKIIGEDTMVVQLLAFSNPSWQFERYLKAMTEAGFSEWYPKELGFSGIDRMWRTVPNRKWYAKCYGKRKAGKEVLLFHKLAIPRC